MPAPPAVQLGSNDCIGGGISPAQLGQVSPLLGGFPAACWSSMQQPVPAPDPILWLRPDELKGLSSKQLVTFWPDASVYGHDAAIDPGNEPVAIPLGGGQFAAGLTISWLAQSILPVIMPGDFAVYWVLVPTIDGRGNVNGFMLADSLLPLGGSPLSFTAGVLQYVGSVDHLSIPYSPTLNSRVLLSVVRTGNAVAFRVNGTQSPVQLLAVVDTFTSVNVIPGMFGFPRLSPQVIIEQRAYSGTVSPSQDASIVASLNARYTIF